MRGGGGEAKRGARGETGGGRALFSCGRMPCLPPFFLSLSLTLKYREVIARDTVASRMGANLKLS